MKKMVWVLVLVFALTTMTMASVKFSFSLGGGIYSGGMDYSFSTTAPCRGETISWKEKAEAIGMSLIPKIGVGIYATPNIELYGSFSTFNGTRSASFNSSIPHYFWYNTLHDIEDVRDTAVKMTAIEFGVAYHFGSEFSQIQAYVGIGGSSISAEMEVLGEVVIEDWLYLWPLREELSIKNVTIKQEKITAVIPHVKVGADFFVSDTIALFVEAGYSLQKTVEIEHEIDGAWWDGLDWTGKDSYDVALGGLSAQIGLKVFIK